MVQFSSLEEVYGSDFTLKYSEKNIQQQQLNKVQFDKNPLPLFLKDKGYNQENCYQVQSFNSSSKELIEPDKSIFPLKNMIGTEKNYQLLQERGHQERNEMIDKMNEIERIPQTQSNEVKKKLLMDKLNHLEKEIRQYRKEYQYATGSPLPPKQELIPQPPPKTSSIQEHFENTQSPKNSQQDIVDLALFVFIGFVVIFFMDSVFKMGKMMGSRKK
jgi:hypothetical protein